MKKFVVLSTMRSGTTWMVSLLDSHEHILCAGEMLHASYDQCEDISYHKELSLGYYLRRHPEKNKQIKHHRRQIIFEYLDWLFDSMTGNSASGFKLMLNHINNFPEVIDYLRERDIKVILLLRLNLVDRLISHAMFSTRKDKNKISVTNKLKRFIHAYRFARQNNRGQLILNPRDIIRKLSKYESENFELVSYSKYSDVEIIHYHNLIENHKSCLDRVFSFLDVDCMELSSSQKKVRTKSISDIVVNYRELNKQLEGTRFQKFL
ncbi:MAG: sulfotransferase [Pseudomonadales bacterium]|nr:sulfotransferase [Pseudomonadales bacterium]